MAKCFKDDCEGRIVVTPDRGRLSAHCNICQCCFSLSRILDELERVTEKWLGGRTRELDPEDAPKEHFHEWLDDGVRVVGWSRESGASKPGKPVRLFASHDDGMVVLEDVAVTSNTQTARPIKDGLCNRLSLTRDECRWLLHRLLEVLASAEIDPR